MDKNVPAAPILVVCYTNHALDQFLEGIEKFHSKGLVRVGGRGKVQSLKKYNLNSRVLNIEDTFFSKKTFIDLKSKKKHFFVNFKFNRLVEVAKCYCSPSSKADLGETIA